jgi:ABC-type multidrug transport system permease subunit
MLTIVWHIIRANFLQLVRDRRALIVMIIMPLGLTAILSFALGNLFGGKSVPPFRVSVYNADDGLVSQSLIQVLKQSEPTIHVVVRQRERDVLNDVANGDSTVGVTVPKTLSEDVHQGHKVKVDVFGPMNRETQIQIVKSIVDAFGQKLVLAKFGGTPSLLSTANSTASPAVQLEVKPTGSQPLTAGSYYAIGMMVMFLLNTAANRANALCEERNSDTYKRMQASPASRLALTIGYWLSYFTVLFVQGLLLLLGCRFLLGIVLGPWTQMVLVVVAYALALAGLTLALGSFIKNHQAMDSVGGLGSQIVAVLGGSIFPLYNFPDILQVIGRVLPNAQAVSALDHSITGTTLMSLVGPIVYLVLFGVGLGLVAVTRFARPSL